MMIEIYRLATTVLVWIGEADHKTQRAFKFATWLSTTFCPYLLPPGLIDPITNHQNSVLQSLPDDDGDWLAWTDLLQRPWFHRVWTMQEVSYCVDIQVYCGGHAIQYYHLWNSFSTLMMQPAISKKALEVTMRVKGSTIGYKAAKDWQCVLQTLMIQAPRINRLKLDHRLGPGPQPYVMFTLLCMTRLRQCKRPEDRVHGVIRHLACITNMDDVPASDCSLPVAVTYSNIVRYLIGKGIGIQVLLQAGLQQRQKLLLPSWCPDFSTYKPTPIWSEANLMAKAEHTLLQLPESLAKYNNMLQGGLQAHKVPLDGANVVSVGTDSDVIILKAQVIDSVLDLGPASCGSLEDPTTMQDFPQYLKWDSESYLTIHTSLSKKRRYPNKSRRTAAYAHAVIASDRVTHKEIKDPGRIYECIHTMVPCPKPAEMIDQSVAFLKHSRRSNFNRRIGITSNGFIGMFPGCTEIGDKVCVAGGSDFPLVMRRTKRQVPLIVEGKRRWTFQFVGDAYIHDMVSEQGVLDNNVRRPEVRLYVI